MSRELLEKAAKAAGIEWNRGMYCDEFSGLPVLRKAWAQADAAIDAARKG